MHQIGCRTGSLRAALPQSASLEGWDERVLSNSKTWGKLIRQSLNVIPISCGDSRKVETMVLKLGDHESSKSLRGSRTSKLSCVPDASWPTGGTERLVGVHFIVLVLYLMIEVAQLRNSRRRKSSSVWTRPERYYGVPSDCGVAGWPVFDVISSGVKRFVRNIGTPSFSDTVLCTRRPESSFVCLFPVVRQEQCCIFWAVHFGHPCRDTSCCLCFTVAAPFGRDCSNLGRLRGKWMWPIVTSCGGGLSLGLRCEVPRMAGCLPQSMWRSDGMTGEHPLPFPLLCWRAGRSREKLRIACQGRHLTLGVLIAVDAREQLWPWQSRCRRWQTVSCSLLVPMYCS